MCNIYALLTQSVIRMTERDGDSEEDFTVERVELDFLKLHMLIIASQENGMSMQCLRHC
jgi:hypothetical protein